MGFKPLIIILLVLALIATYGIGGAETVSKKIEQYTDEKFKSDAEQYEKYTFINATYCNWTAKYTRTLELLDKYDVRFEKEQYREKSQYLRAQTVDAMLNERGAKDEYKKYIDEFPEGKNFEKANERYQELKIYH